MEVGNGVAVAGRGRFPDAQSLNRAESVAHVVEPERLGVVVDAAAGLLALMDVEHRCVDSAVLASTGPQAGHDTGGLQES